MFGNTAYASYGLYHTSLDDNSWEQQQQKFGEASERLSWGWVANQSNQLCSVAFILGLYFIDFYF